MEDEQRDFTDRSLCELLSKPEHLRDLLKNAFPDLVEGFEFGRMRPAPQEFLLGNWRRRKPDVLVEIPFQSEEGERWALVCILLEHQSRTDRQVPLKTFTYAALYWEWQWRIWESSPAPRDPLVLTPILPIVLFTGPRPWASARTLRDLLGPPEAFHGFCPDWQPHFWELAKHSADELVNGSEAFLQAIAIFKTDDAELEEAQQLFHRIFQKIDPLHESGRVRWRDLLGLILGWAHNRRSNAERQAWSELANRLETSSPHRQEIQAMATSIAQSLIQEGREQGLASGKGSAVSRFGKRRLGPPSEAILAALDAITDLDRLNRLIDRLDDVRSWEELLQTP